MGIFTGSVICVCKDLKVHVCCLNSNREWRIVRLAMGTRRGSRILVKGWQALSNQNFNSGCLIYSNKFLKIPRFEDCFGEKCKTESSLGQFLDSRLHAEMTFTNLRNPPTLERSRNRNINFRPFRTPSVSAPGFRGQCPGVGGLYVGVYSIAAEPLTRNVISTASFNLGGNT